MWYILYPTGIPKDIDRQWLVKRVILDYRAHVCVFQGENYFHLMYNMFLKSMFKDFSNDVLIETNSQLLWKLCSKQSSILHVCCSQTVPRFMS